MKNIYLLVLLFLPVYLYAQTDSSPLRIMWYNVENLFDTVDDPEKDDNEFLPESKRHWTNNRYGQKLQQIAKVITSAGEWDMPTLIGMCEVENDSVMEHLIRRTPLRSHLYDYCITSGSDTRGINNALLYRRDRFAYINHHSHPIQYTEGREKPTRDILHVWGETIGRDTLDLFLCHFPSRSGGEKETEAFRIDAANTLRALCDSVYKQRSSPYLILMGDFNDMPHDKSIAIIEQGEPRLTNLFRDPSPFTFPGSYRYRGEWNQLDQIFVSPLLLDTTRRVHLIPQSQRIFAPEYVLIEDSINRGPRPFRTYMGLKYEGGYSDHLPLIIDLRTDSK